MTHSLPSFLRSNLRVLSLLLLLLGSSLLAQAQRSIKQQATDARITVDLLVIQQQALNPQNLPLELQDPDKKNTILTKGNLIGIEAVVVDGQQAQTLLLQLQAIGLTEGIYEQRIVSGYLPVDRIADLKSLPALRFAQPLYEPIHNTGKVTTQGDRALKADIARQLYAVTGRGSKIGVLSDSYNANGGAAAGVASDDLPPNVQILDDLASGSDEGRAMMELIHDVAPAAAGAFNTAFRSQAGFAKGIRDLAAAGCNIIVDDVYYFTEPFFQDGIIAQAVDEVKAKGVSYFSSAGNNARNSYQAAYREAPYSGPFAQDPYLGAHNFSPTGTDVYHSITVPANTSIRLGLQWDEPFASVSGGAGAQSDLDVLVYKNGALQSAGLTNNLGGDPIEVITLSNLNSATPTTFEVVIGHYAGPAPALIKWVAFTNGAGITFEYPTYSSTCYGHANAAGAIATGAADYRRTPVYNGASTATIEGFSSAGGTPILFTTSGQRISAVLREKPEITAVDGGNTTFFGSDADGDGFRNFFGTSAAAPHAAAVAALMQERSSIPLTPDKTTSILKQTALDMDDPLTPGFDTGFDTGTGYGFIQADQAVLMSNTPPTVVNAIPPQSATVGQTYTYTIPANTFTDAETPNSLKLSVMGLPPGIVFTAPNRLSGTPQATTTGTPFSVTVVATDPGNVTANTTFTFTLSPGPSLSGFGATPASVCIGSSVSFTANVSGAYSYTLTNGTDVLITGTRSDPTFSQSVTPSTTGTQTYTLLVGRNGQTTSVTTNLTVNALPTAGLTNNGPLNCTMTAVTLTATGGSSYMFTDGNGQVLAGAGDTRNVNSPGTYAVRVANEAGCTSTTTTSVTSNTVVVTATLAASPSTTLTCSQPTLTLTASGGDTYRFSPNVASQTGNQATVTQAGVYSVTATSTATGCFSTTSITISQDNAAPSASLASSGPLSCTVTSATLTANPNGQSYRFSDGATPIGTTNQATVTTAGTYSVTVLSGNGCSSVASVTVTGDQTPPTVSITPTSGTLTCANPTLTLTANTSAPTLRWSNGQTTPSITVNAVGTYSVSVTGTNGCSATSNAVRIESAQDAPPATLLASGGLSCAVTSVTLTANTGSGLSYRFSSGATQVGNGNTATVNVAGTYSVTVTNTATGCTNTASVVVGQDNSQPTVSISPSSATLTCGMPTATLTATTSASSLLWSTGQTTPSISVNVAGTYSVTVTATNGCQAVAQATVSGTTDAPIAPTLAAAPATTTSGQPITVTANGCMGGTITWTALGGTGQASGNTYTLAQPGNYTLSATCSLNGCTSPASAPLALQIRPGGFAITGVSMVSCELFDEAKGGYRVQFTPQYTGQTSDPISFSVVNELATTTAPAPYSLRLYTDNPVITLVAAQAGNGEARFAYNWLASCQSGTSLNRPPTTTGIPSQTIVQGQAYQLQLTSYVTDPDGQALTFQASGLPAGLSLSGSVISGTPAQPGVSTVNVTAIDPGGLPVSTSFTLTVSPMPVTPPSGFTIVGVSTVSCQVIGAGERQLTFTPQYAGVSGGPISFSVVNELRPTTTPGPYMLRLYTDNPTITLSAQQGSAVSSYRYNWLAVCNPAGRLSAKEAVSGLQVTVLGNPVVDQQLEVVISGVDGQLVDMTLVDLQGVVLQTHRLEQAAAVDRVRLAVGALPGVFMLQVNTATERRVIKLLKP